MSETAQGLALALAIGLLVGVERGWRRRDAMEGRRAVGVRTFALTGLLGGLAGLLGDAMGGVAFAAVLACFSYALIAWVSREQAVSAELSMTSVVAAIAVFCLGAGAVLMSPVAIAGAAVVLTGFLAFKAPIHRWIARLTWEELRSAIVLLAMTLVVLPLIPNCSLGPSRAVNPRELWLLTILLTGASFLAYVAGKWLGAGRGLVVGSLLGAIVSSTAVTFSLAQAAKAEPKLAATAAGSASLASGVMTVRIAMIAAALSMPMAVDLAAPIAAFAIVSIFSGALLLKHGQFGALETAPKVRSPFDLAVVLKFTIVLGAVLALARTLSATVGASGLLSVAALGGLVDVDAVTIAAGQAAASGRYARLLPIGAILLAVLMDSMTKVTVGFVQGGNGFGRRFGLSTLAALTASACTLALEWRHLGP